VCKEKNETKETKHYPLKFHCFNLCYMQTIMLLKTTNWKSSIQF